MQRLHSLRRCAVLGAGWITLSACAFLPVRAHDFWIEPSTFTPEAGSLVRLALKVGERFQGNPVPRNDERIHKFVLMDARGEIPALGLPGADPAGTARVGADGVVIAGYLGRPVSTTLEAARFEAYLREEGLESVIEARVKHGQSAAPGREIYSRCAKAIMQVGAQPGAGFDRPLGCAFELIPESLPRGASVGPMTFLALARGKPVQGIKVVGLRAGGRGAVEARTGADGRAALALDGAGAWLVKAVGMSPAPADSGADWESVWASVTFVIAGPSSPGDEPRGGQRHAADAPRIPGRSGFVGRPDARPLERVVTESGRTTAASR